MDCCTIPSVCLCAKCSYVCTGLADYKTARQRSSPHVILYAIWLLISESLLSIHYVIHCSIITITSPLHFNMAFNDYWVFISVMPRSSVYIYICQEFQEWQRGIIFPAVWHRIMEGTYSFRLQGKNIMHESNNYCRGKLRSHKHEDCEALWRYEDFLGSGMERPVW
jgi:hypothetical protein